MKDKKKLRLLKAVLLLITIACLLPVGQSCCLSIQHEKQQREFRNMKQRRSTAETAKEEEFAAEEGMEAAKTDGAVMLPGLAELYARNNDLVGWLTVEGTKIDYPVMQCDDDEYYLYHNFDKEKDKYGCLYVKSIADIHTPGTNAVIYGHHMKDDSMFGDLDRYESEKFYKQHGEIFLIRSTKHVRMRLWQYFRHRCLQRKMTVNFSIIHFIRRTRRRNFSISMRM